MKKMKMTMLLSRAAPPIFRSVDAIHPEIAPKATGMRTSVQATSPRYARQR